MARILQPVLRALDAIYRFDSNRQAPEAFDVEGSITPVHDVRREVELAATRASVFELIVTTAGIDFAEATAAQVLATCGVRPDEDAWIIAAGVEADTPGALTSATAGLEIVTLQGASGPSQITVFRSVASSPLELGGVQVGYVNGVAHQATTIQPVPLPSSVWSRLLYRAQHGAAATSTFRAYLAVAPKGVLPPGLA